MTPSDVQLEAAACDQRPTRPDSPMLAGALSLVEVLGARVLPVHFLLPNGACSCGKPCDERSRAKHPIEVKWQINASADETIVRAMWARHPNANIGIATGVGSGIVVLDVDGPEGEATLAALEAEHGPLPATPQVRTSRGRHLYFAAGTIPIHNRAGKRGRGLGKGLDVRGEGGQAVAPPSVHASGFVYSWVPGFTPADVALAPLPPWLVMMVTTAVQAVEPLPPPPPPPPRSYVGTRAERWAGGALDKEIALVTNAPVGTRNETLNTAAFNAGMLVAGGLLDGAEARAALMSAAKTNGLGEFEALKTIMSGMAAGMKKDARTAPTRDRADYVPTNGRAAHRGDTPTNGAAHGDSDEPPGPDSPTVGSKPSSDPPRFEIVGPAEIFAPLPPPRWAVEGLQIGPGRPTLIIGYGASGKTLAVQSLALSLTSGRPVWQRFPSDALRVVHLDYEQTFGPTATRYQRLALAGGIALTDLGGRLGLNLHLPRLRLDSAGAREALLVLACRYDVIVIDSLCAALGGVDENSSEVRQYLDLLTSVSDESGCTFIVLHHSAKPKEHHTDGRTLARGSSAIFDAAGAVFTFVRKSPDKPIRVAMVKPSAASRGQTLEPFELHIEDVPAADGCDPHAGVRVRWNRIDRAASNANDADRLFDVDAAELLRRIGRIAQPPGMVQDAVVARCGMRKTRALTVLSALEAEGRVTVTIGPKGKRYYHLATPTGGA